MGGHEAPLRPGRRPVRTSKSCPESALSSLKPFQEHLTIVSNTDVRMAEAFTTPEIGGDHFRSSAVFLTQSHPKQTQGSDIHVGTSLDQLYAQRFGQDTPLPSMQFCIENLDQAGGCTYNYSCAYTDTISWASPNEPLPMIRDPRVAFDMLFGAGGTPEERAARRASRRSILDWMAGEIASLKRELGAVDRVRMDRYLENVREIERRIATVESRNTGGEERELPEAPAGVPDSFSEHMRLMFDLQVLALETNMTRVISFKTGRDADNRVFPESGSDRPFHPASHHGSREDGDPRVQQDLPVPGGTAPVLPGEAPAKHGGRREPARQDDDHVGLADGGLEPAQPPPLSPDPPGRGRWPAGGQPPPEGTRRDADGERHAGGAQRAGHGYAGLRRQYGRVLADAGVFGGDAGVTMKRVTLLTGAVVLALTGAIPGSDSALPGPDSPVADAAMRGDVAAVRKLLAGGADVNAAQGDGMTALHWAAEYGDAELARMLLHAGAAVAPATRIGSYAPLHIAARNGHTSMAVLLLEAGGDATAAAPGTGATPLHLAAAAGAAELVVALIERGADIDAREAGWGQTPLMFAASMNRVDAIRALLDAGADPDITSRVEDLVALSALDRLANRRRSDAIKALTADGARSPTAGEFQAAVRAARAVYAEGLPEDEEEEEEDDFRPRRITAKGGLTALLHAVRQGHREATAALLDGGAHIDLPSASDGTSPLLMATINGQFDLALELVARGADPSVASALNGATPLWAAVNARWQPRTRYPQPQEMGLQTATYVDVMEAAPGSGRGPGRAAHAPPVVHGVQRVRQPQLRPRRHRRRDRVLAGRLRDRRGGDAAPGRIRRRPRCRHQGASAEAPPFAGRIPPAAEPEAACLRLHLFGIGGLRARGAHAVGTRRPPGRHAGRLPGRPSGRSRRDRS